MEFAFDEEKPPAEAYSFVLYVGNVRIISKTRRPVLTVWRESAKSSFMVELPQFTEQFFRKIEDGGGRRRSNGGSNEEEEGTQKRGSRGSSDGRGGGGSGGGGDEVFKKLDWSSTKLVPSTFVRAVGNQEELMESCGEDHFVWKSGEPLPASPSVAVDDQIAVEKKTDADVTAVEIIAKNKTVVAHEGPENDVSTSSTVDEDRRSGSSAASSSQSQNDEKPTKTTAPVRWFPFSGWPRLRRKTPVSRRRSSVASSVVNFGAVDDGDVGNFGIAQLDDDGDVGNFGVVEGQYLIDLAGHRTYSSSGDRMVVCAKDAFSKQDVALKLFKKNEDFLHEREILARLVDSRAKKFDSERVIMRMLNSLHDTYRLFPPFIAGLVLERWLRDLQTELDENGHGLTVLKKRMFAEKMVRCVAWIHSRKIVWGGCELTHFLLVLEQDGDFSLKATEFGTAGMSLYL